MQITQLERQHEFPKGQDINLEEVPNVYLFCYFLCDSYQKCGIYYCKPTAEFVACFNVVGPGFIMSYTSTRILG